MKSTEPSASPARIHSASSAERLHELHTLITVARSHRDNAAEGSPARAGYDAELAKLEAEQTQLQEASK